MPSSLNRILLGALLVTPIAAWAFFKPVRVFAPELVGVTCSDSGVCVDAPSRLEQAAALRDEAVRFVQANVASVRSVPRMIFCSTTECASSFGLTRQAAYSLSTYGIIVSPRGWKPYYVRHELIHHLQCERLGRTAELFKPKWFVEGMAYSLSDDPRHPLSEPFEGYRAKFDAWRLSIKDGNLWAAAEGL